jgi:hypothetical protein
LRTESGKGGFLKWNWGEDFHFDIFGCCAAGALGEQIGNTEFAWKSRGGCGAYDFG